MTNFDPWDVREPVAMLEEVLARGRPTAGDVLVALLNRADAPEQPVVDVVRVHSGAPPGRHEGSELLRDHACRLVDPRPWTGEGWAPPEFVLVTIVCRTGRVVPGPHELMWLMAWRYSNHLGNAFDGDVYLLTDHGWTGCHDRRAGFTPSLSAASRHLSLLPAERAPAPTRSNARPRPGTRAHGAR